MFGESRDGIQESHDALERSSEDVKAALRPVAGSAQKARELFVAVHSTAATTIVGMSRPTLMKLADPGVAKHIRVGAHHLIPMREVVKSRRTQQIDHSEADWPVEKFRGNISFRGSQ